MKLHSLVTEEQYFDLTTLVRDKNQAVFQTFQNFLGNNDVEGFKDWVLNRFASHRRQQQNMHSAGELARPSTSRPGMHRLSTFTGHERPSSSQPEARRNYPKFIQVVVELEDLGRLEASDLVVIKTFILREHPELMREFDNYFLHKIDLYELSARLQRLASSLAPLMERPTSAMPRKHELQMLVNTLLKENFPSEEDMGALNALIAEENEFVFAAFDVFESDRNTVELVDSLARAVAKRRGPEGLEPRALEELENNLEVTKHWEPELRGTFKGLELNRSRALVKAFELYSRTEDLDALEAQLYVICNCYFQVLLCRYFTFEQVRLFRRETRSQVTAAFTQFSDTGDAQCLVLALLGLAHKVCVVEQDPWAEVLELLESPKVSTEEAKDPDNNEKLQSIFSRSEFTESEREQLLGLFSANDPGLLQILSGVSNSEDLLSVESQVKGLLRKESKFSEELLEEIRNHLPDDDKEYFDKYYHSAHPYLIGSIEVFASTRSVEDFTENFEILLSLNERRDPHEQFLDFVHEAFTLEDQAEVLRMIETQDSRLKSALEVHDLDIADDRKDLAEIISYILKQ